MKNRHKFHWERLVFHGFVWKRFLFKFHSSTIETQTFVETVPRFCVEQKFWPVVFGHIFRRYRDDNFVDRATKRRKWIKKNQFQGHHVEDTWRLVFISISMTYKFRRYRDEISATKHRGHYYFNLEDETWKYQWKTIANFLICISVWPYSLYDKFKFCIAINMIFPRLW